MIVRDESDNLHRCLSSVKDIVDEIIIVDTGSKDNTIEIAESFGAKIFKFKWEEDFAAARNYSLSKCGGNFILYLDADEILSENSKLSLRELVAGNQGKAFSCLINNISSSSDRSSIGRYCRIFPNHHGLKFEGKVHEQIEYSLSKNNIEIIDSDIEIIHYGYDADKEALNAKALRNLELLLAEYSLNPSGYNSYQIALTYSLLNEIEKAKDYFEIALQDETLHKDYKFYSYEFLTNYFLQNKDLVKAKTFLEKLFAADSTRASAYLLASKIFSAEKNYERALMFAASSYEFNLSAKNDKSKLVQVILSDNEIITHGLHLAVYSGLLDYFKHFIDLYGKIGFEQLAEIMRKLNSQERLEGDDISALINNIADENIDILLLLLKKYHHKDISFSIYEFLIKSFEDNPNLIINYSELLYNKGKKEEAINLLELNFSKFIDNPAPAFYLMSYYIENSEFHKLEAPLQFLETHFSNDAIVIEGLNQLNNQINTILN